MIPAYYSASSFNVAVTNVRVQLIWCICAAIVILHGVNVYYAHSFQWAFNAHSFKNPSFFFSPKIANETESEVNVVVFVQPLQYPGLLAAVSSLTNNTSRPDLLTLHVFTSDKPSCLLKKLECCNCTDLDRITVHQLDGDANIALARFKLPTLLPAIDIAIVLPPLSLIQGDVWELHREVSLGIKRSGHTRGRQTALYGAPSVVAPKVPFFGKRQLPLQQSGEWWMQFWTEAAQETETSSLWRPAEHLRLDWSGVEVVNLGYWRSFQASDSQAAIARMASRLGAYEKGWEEESDSEKTTERQERQETEDEFARWCLDMKGSNSLSEVAGRCWLLLFCAVHRCVQLRDAWTHRVDLTTPLSILNSAKLLQYQTEPWLDDPFHVHIKRWYNFLPMMCCLCGRRGAWFRNSCACGC
eukprot:Platyproteum_vivax@DN101_c0_g1_i1.p1